MKRWWQPTPLDLLFSELPQYMSISIGFYCSLVPIVSCNDFQHYCTFLIPHHFSDLHPSLVMFRLLGVFLYHTNKVSFFTGSAIGMHSATQNICHLLIANLFLANILCQARKAENTNRMPKWGEGTWIAHPFLLHINPLLLSTIDQEVQ